MKTKKYKLIGGGHRQDGVDYKRGDIIETNMDLCALFQNKFIDLSGGPDIEEKSAVKISAPSPEAPPVIEQNEEEDDTEEDVEEEAHKPRKRRKVRTSK